MRHAFLIGVLCLAVAMLGIAGVHAHLGGHDQHGAHLIAFVAADHAADHHDGDLDIDPLVKAFRAVSLTAAFIAIAVFCCFVELNALGGFVRWLPAMRLLRPPCLGLRSHLLPPAHAPPMPLD
jgi:hypothetical protein